MLQHIQDAGHTVEVHKIHTEDNYILTVFRLPSKLKNPKIVFIMHGLESSAADYVIEGKNASLPYLLSDNGYDVWLGNARGNIFSRTHKKLSVESHDFWKFSFHEIGVYDYPAMIDYVLNKGGKTASLSYCGYSQGTTALFILLSMRPEFDGSCCLYAFSVASSSTSCLDIGSTLGLRTFKVILWHKTLGFQPRELGNFIRFDNQKRKNLELYGQPVPPEYNLSNVRTNMHFLYGANDILANPKDAEFLIAKLKAHVTGITKLTDWNHLDFIFGKEVQKKVNNVILQKIKSSEK